MTAQTVKTSHSIQKVRKCSDFISLFPFSISFCVAQQNREQETPGGSGLHFTSPAQADQQVILSPVWNSTYIPKNVVCWARVLKKSVSSKLLSSEAPWNCYQPPKPTLAIVFKGLVIKYLPGNSLMCVSIIHKCLLAPLQMTSDTGNSSCMAQCL